MTVQQISECFENALLEGAQEVFETMMFSTVEPTDEMEESTEGNSLLGSITFKGDYEGVMTIVCSPACAEVLAKNMLGMAPDEEISTEETQDALGEIANMVMGSLKARIMEVTGDFQVSIPSVISGEHLESSLGDKATTIDINVAIDENIAKLGVIYRVKADS